MILANTAPRLRPTFPLAFLPAARRGCSPPHAVDPRALQGRHEAEPFPRLHHEEPAPETSMYPRSSSMAQLDIEVEELERWNCCGTVHALGAENVMNRVAPVTNLIRVKETAAKTEGMASEFMTSCAMCYNTLKRANIDVKKNPDKLATINAFLNLETTKYAGRRGGACICSSTCATASASTSWPRR